MDAAVVDSALHSVCVNWNHRVKQLALPGAKTKIYKDQQEAFIQGAMAALLAAGIVTDEAYQRIAFLCAIGRLDEWVQSRAAGATTLNVPA